MDYYRVLYFFEKFKEIIPEKGFRWNIGSIYVVKHIHDVIKVKGEM